MLTKQQQQNKGFLSCTFTEPQLFSKFQVGRQAFRLQIGNKHILLKDGGILLLLPTGGHSGMQTTYLDSTSNNVIKATVYVDISSYENKKKGELCEVST